MPQYIWNGIFSILNVLVPSVVLALFASHYQNRRKREIQIEGKLAINRIDGYEQILSCFYEGQNLHEISLKEEDKATAILEYFDVETFNFQCPDAFKNETSLTYGSFCRIECAPIPYKHRHSERFKVLSCKIELFNSSIGHFAG